MKLIVGLGNPGKEYKHNRHNVGYMFLDYLSQVLVGKNQVEVPKFIKDKYLLSEVCEINKLILLAKPQTYMNKSGAAVKKLLERYSTSHEPPFGYAQGKLIANHLIIVHDDLDIPFGKFKIQTQGPKQHNGLTDIQNKLQTTDFLRIRIGVDNRNPENRMNGEEYVLQDFDRLETAQLDELFKKIEVQFELILYDK